MTFSEIRTHFEWRFRVLPFILLFILSKSPTLLSLSQDGIFLLSFKHAVLLDPLSSLADWNSSEETPCSWNGVICTGFPAGGVENGLTWDGEVNPDSSTVSRVVSLVLPGAGLSGTIPGELGFVQHLRHLDLSSNVLNGTLPPALFHASELSILSLAGNKISGELPELFGKLRNLRVLNLSENALVGSIPGNLTLLPNLTVVYLGNNRLSGELPGGGFRNAELLDLGSNLLNGSLPPDLAGGNIRCLNLSSNRFAGEIPPELGLKLPSNATLDLSFNNFTGEIPPNGAFQEQKAAAFAGNPDLCGRPLESSCTVPSTLSDPPYNSSPAANTKAKSPPAFAVMPKTGEFPTTSGGDENSPSSHSSTGLKPATIAAIAVGDLAGLGLLSITILFVHHRNKNQKQQKQSNTGLSSCMRKNGVEETSESNASSETETEEEGGTKAAGKEASGGERRGGKVVTVDGETKLEVETLLKASAYIVGATGASIVYKAVLADGREFAVRRIGEGGGVEKVGEFETRVRAIARLRHRNILPIRGFYCGADEKLLIHDYAPNGSLASIFFSKKLGSSPPLHLSWTTRLRIARGVARGLSYLHDRKCVHGNLKPSNILLTADNEPMIGDLGLDRLLPLRADGDPLPSASARQFGSRRSSLSQGSLPDPNSPAALSPPPYQAPESLKNLRPSPKWDVFSFGMVLLELLSGRVFLEVELMKWNAAGLEEEEDKKKVLRMTDPALRGEVEGKEDAVLACFKLGFGCASIAAQRRPSMKDAVQLLEKLSAASASSS